MLTVVEPVVMLGLPPALSSLRASARLEFFAGSCKKNSTPKKQQSKQMTNTDKNDNNHHNHNHTIVVMSHYLREAACPGLPGGQTTSYGMSFILRHVIALRVALYYVTV